MLQPYSKQESVVSSCSQPGNYLSHHIFTHIEQMWHEMQNPSSNYLLPKETLSCFCCTVQRSVSVKCYFTGLTTRQKIYIYTFHIPNPSVHIMNAGSFMPRMINPLPSLTLQSARDLNVPCRPKRSKALLLTSSPMYCVV
jgi:hypothetical protein